MEIYFSQVEMGRSMWMWILILALNSSITDKSSVFVNGDVNDNGMVMVVMEHFIINVLQTVVNIYNIWK